MSLVLLPLCKGCAKPVSPRTRSWLCRVCVKQDPAFRARLSAAVKKSIAANPELREVRRRNARAQARRPEERAARAERAKKQRLWEIGSAARGPETFARMARSISETRMAWCPPELRDQARRLTKKKHIPLAEVKVIILAQHKANMAKFRRQLGGQA